MATEAMVRLCQAVYSPCRKARRLTAAGLGGPERCVCGAPARHGLPGGGSAVT